MGSRTEGGREKRRLRRGKGRDWDREHNIQREKEGQGTSQRDHEKKEKGMQIRTKMEKEKAMGCETEMEAEKKV